MLNNLSLVFSNRSLCYKPLKIHNVSAGKKTVGVFYKSSSITVMNFKLALNELACKVMNFKLSDSLSNPYKKHNAGIFTVIFNVYK